MANKDTNIQNSSVIGFENKIWEAADILRGTVDPAEYKNVVLGLIFLKYLSDCFKAKYQQLVEDGEGFEEDPDEYMADGIFFVPKEARWETIASAATTPEIGKVIDAAMIAIEKQSNRLKGVLPKNFARPELDKRRLGEVVNVFTNSIDFGKDQESRDLIGRTYEYCLNKFDAETKQSGGEFYTPSSIVRTIVEVLEPYHGSVYDPSCGSGGMFVQSAQFIRQHQGHINDISIYGQELNANTRKLAIMNLTIRGMEADLGPQNADTFFKDLFPSKLFDFIMANPPFNMSNWGADKLQDDPRWKFGIPSDGNANFAWMQHMIYHLSPKGRMGMVLANGSMTSNTGNEGIIRKNIICADLVEGIVALPNKLFYNTQIPVCLWFLSRRKQQPGKVLFIDARNLGEAEDRTHWRLDYDRDIMRIANTFRSYRQGTLEPEQGFSAVKTIDEIAEQDYVLTPGRYVGIAEQEDDGVPFEEKMERLTTELSSLFEESHELEERIKEQLGMIGFHIE